MQGVYSLLRKILKEQKSIKQEQKKQTKILQAIESSKEQEIAINMDSRKVSQHLSSAIHDIH